MAEGFASGTVKWALTLWTSRRVSGWGPSPIVSNNNEHQEIACGKFIHSKKNVITSHSYTSIVWLITIDKKTNIVYFQYYNFQVTFPIGLSLLNACVLNSLHYRINQSGKEGRECSESGIGREMRWGRLKACSPSYWLYAHHSWVISPQSFAGCQLSGPALCDWWEVAAMFYNQSTT